VTRLCNSHHQRLYLYIVLGMGGLFATAVAAEVCRYGYIPTEEEICKLITVCYSHLRIVVHNA
jgi:hypothetical protein